MQKYDCYYTILGVMGVLTIGDRSENHLAELELPGAADFPVFF
jgi:hypothetical protein